MICPNCGSRLTGENLKDQIVDNCPNCRGLWCPTGNTGWYIRLCAQSGYKKQVTEPANKGWLCEDRLPAEKEEPKTTEAPCSENKPRQCPSCGSLLNLYPYDLTSTITLEECPDCHGIWIDFEKIGMLINHLGLVPARPMQKPDRSISRQAIPASENTTGTEEALEAFFRNNKPAYENTIEIPIIRRILGIPCVERTLSITPWATIAIITINTLIFFLCIVPAQDKQAFFSALGFTPANIASEPLTALITFFTAMFMHGGLGHLFSNMMFLWLFGGRIEEDYGSNAFIGVYAIAGIIAGLSHTVANLGSPIPIIGASGAISGILGTFFILHPKNRVVTYFMLIPIPMSAAVFLGIWFTMQIFNSVLTAAAGGAGIAWFAHIGGFIAGALMAYPLKRQVETIAEEQSKIAA